MKTEQLTRLFCWRRVLCSALTVVPLQGQPRVKRGSDDPGRPGRVGHTHHGQRQDTGQATPGTARYVVEDVPCVATQLDLRCLLLARCGYLRHQDRPPRPEAQAGQEPQDQDRRLRRVSDRG